MSDELNNESAAIPGNDDNLPPVQPPSAGFIVQLFLVPGLIVLAVVGVWALFGKMASSEQNWQRLVEEIKQENPHRRWRGATGLIQLLRADQERGEAGEKLSENPEVAKALAGMLKKELQSKAMDEEAIKQRRFLARGLRLLDVPEVVLPVLMETMKLQTNDDGMNDVRKNAVASVAVILGRARDADEKAGYGATKSKKNAGDDSRDPPLPPLGKGGNTVGPKLKRIIEFPGLVDDLILVSGDSEPLMRQIGAYALGLIPLQPARDRLEVLAEDKDVNTRINAAIGLARQGSTKGLPVFKDVFKQAANEKEALKGTHAAKTSQYLRVGLGAMVLIIFAVWAFGTTKIGRRVFAAAIAMGALVFTCWGIYGIVQETNAAPADEPGLSSEEFAEHQKQARNERFERLVAVQNALKAVGDLQGRIPKSERTELAKLVEPLAEKHPEPRIRIDAKKTLRSLRDDG